MDAWGSFHKLFKSLSNHDGHAVYEAVLEPWLNGHQEAREWLALLAQREGNPFPAIEIEESWTLYALGRALDLLRREDVPISSEEHVAFVEALGLDVLRPQRFSPFYQCHAWEYDGFPGRGSGRRRNQSACRGNCRCVDTVLDVLAQ